MVRIFATTLILMLSSLAGHAQPELAAINDRAVQDHIRPGVQAFKTQALTLQDAALANCDPDAPDLIRAFHDTFDAWTRISHLRFGPTETQDRAFALAFWPDGRSKTPKALGALLKQDDPALTEPDAFKDASIAARGLYPLEFLLYDGQTRNTGSPDAQCRLVQAIARDVADNAVGIADDWDQYADHLRIPAQDGPYRTHAEVTQELYKALSTGLQFTTDTRLGRPLGTFERPRPTRAELWRSGRSLKQVELSLSGTQDLAMILAAQTPGIAGRLDALYAAAFNVAADLNDPIFARVSDVQGRLRVEILQLSIEQIRELVALELGPALGVAAGFNALDGD